MEVEKLDSKTLKFLIDITSSRQLFGLCWKRPHISQAFVILA